jgi:uncharacterized protein (TIGR03000 family)
MYSVVLMAALTTGAAEPAWCWGCHGSAYIHSCGGCSGCSCCGGCNGGWTCWGTCAGWTGYGYYGGCYGCWGTGYACYGGCGGSWGCMGYYTCSGQCWGGSCHSDYAPSYVEHPVYSGPPGAAPRGTVGPAPDQPRGPGIPPAPGITPETAPKPKPKPDGDKNPGQARLIIDVPAEAKLYIDDHLMKTPSAHRTFRTPLLEPGQSYYYILRAELTQDGKQYSASKRLVVRSGETAQASFVDLASARNEQPKSVARAGR